MNESLTYKVKHLYLLYEESVDILSIV